MTKKHSDNQDGAGLGDSFFDQGEGGQTASPSNLVGEEEEQELERIFQSGPARARHPVLAGTVAAASLLVLWMMRADITYYFQGSKPKELGDISKALADGKLEANTYVRLRGLPDLNTKATVSRKGCGLAPNTGATSYYNFYIVQNTGDAVVVRRSLTAKQREQEAKHPVLELDVKGRLVRFANQKEFFLKYRKYIIEASRTFPALKREHDIPRSEIRAKAGKRGRTTLVDSKREKVVVTADSPISLYVVFPNELEYRLDRTFTLSADHVTFVGGAGPKCPSDFSGSAVVLVKDPKTLDFGPDIKTKARIEAKAPQQGSGAASKDMRILVPPDTKVYDSATGDPIPFKGGSLTVVQGGACGKPGQTRQINIESHPLYTLKAAKLYLQHYGLPFGLVEQDADSFLFIIKGPPKKLEPIVKAQRRTSPYSTSSRTDWFEARWSEIRLEEDTLVIRPARPSHPPRYVVAEVVRKAPRKDGAKASQPANAGSAPAAAKDEKATQKKAGTATPGPAAKKGTSSTPAAAGKARPTPEENAEGPIGGKVVIKKPWQGEVRFPVAWVDHATLTQIRNVPKDAWLLLEGIEPGKFWYYPVLGLLLVLFALYNLWAIRGYFKYVKNADRPK